ncbi:MAG TPA: DNA-protecting protein DprA [Actinomyces sp.]|jgi:DNA processing protein|nr:DNA-protecting protein DprA [Actinomyces sp.]
MEHPNLDSPLEVACAWSAIVEPGDEAAGLLRKSMGSALALEWLLSQPNPAKLPRNLTHDSDGRVRPWTQALNRWIPRVQELDVQRDLAQLEAVNGHVLYPEHPDWPTKLDDLNEGAPAALWVRGQLKQAPSVAIVGARASSNAGNNLARDVAFELAQRGISIISGGAFGIDAAAHKGALAAGHTVAVMAGGVSNLYPKSHIDLFDQILESGAIIAESPPSWRPARWRFLSRNRLIAALADASVVVEASPRSGALATIRHARELNRPVGAFPGPVTSHMSRGCHQMIRQGVTLVTSSEDVLELSSEIGDALFELPKEENKGLPAELVRVYDAMPARGFAAVDSIARVAGLGKAEVEAALATLILKGYVECQADEFKRVR